MGRILIILLFIYCGCTPKNESSKFIGFWKNEGAIEEWMKIQLLIENDNKFTYWFFSDRKRLDQPKMPLKGTYEIKGNRILLSIDENLHLYAREFILTDENGKPVLLAAHQLNDWENNGKVDCHPLYKQKKFEEPMILKSIESFLDHPTVVVQNTRQYRDHQKSIKNLKCMIEERGEGDVIVKVYEDHETHTVRLETFKVTRDSISHLGVGENFKEN